MYAEWNGFESVVCKLLPDNSFNISGTDSKNVGRPRAGVTVVICVNGPSAAIVLTAVVR